MIGREDVRQAVARVAVVWPSLAKRDELRQEIGNAVLALSDRLEPIDVERGINLLIRSAPTKANDGGPAWPPGPNEVTGCILKARSGRVDEKPQRVELKNTAPVPVTNRRCCREGCMGILEYVATERVLRCQNCNSVQVREFIGGSPRIHLTYDEVQALSLSDEEAETGSADDAHALIMEMSKHAPKAVTRRMNELLAI